MCATEESLRCRAQPSRDLDFERDELRAVIEVMVMLHVVAQASPVGALEILCLLRRLPV